VGLCPLLVLDWHGTRLIPLASELTCCWNSYTRWSALIYGWQNLMTTRQKYLVTLACGCGRTESQGSYECSNVLVSVSAKGRSVELKSLAINPARPAQVALTATQNLIMMPTLTLTLPLSRFLITEAS